MTNQRKPKIPNRGNARGAQTRKLRRDALREELQAREYLRQIDAIDQTLQENWRDLASGELQALKLRADLQFRRLAKVLPDLRLSSQRVSVNGLSGSLTEMGRQIIAAIGGGDVSPEEGAAMLQALAAQARITEIDELAKRVSELESKREVTNGKS
jgi:hypothetical protein